MSVDTVRDVPLPTQSGSARRLPAAGLIALGLIAGLLGGLFGAGTTVLLTPTMVGFFGFTQHRAQGTAVTVGLFTAVVGAVTYSRQGHVAWAIATPMILVAVVFAAVGAHAVTRVSAARLQVISFLLILIAAVRLAVF